MNNNNEVINYENKRLIDMLFRVYIEENKNTTEQKVFSIVFCLFLFGPVIFLLPFVFLGYKVTAIVLLFVSWIIGMSYALIRKRRIINKIISVKSNDFNTEKIVVTDMDIFDNIDRNSIFSIGVDGNIDSKFYNILYNWLNNLNLLKDGKLKVYCLNGSQFKKKYDVSGISDTSNILFILLDDLNINDSNREEFSWQRTFFGLYLDEILKKVNK